MRPQVMTNLATYSVLGTAVAVSALLPAQLGPRSTVAGPPTVTGDTTIDISTVVRDFKSGHPDFKPGMSGASGHIAGNVLATLPSSGRPAFVGVNGGPVTSFNISADSVKPQEEFAVMITCLGAAIGNNDYDNPVTARITIDGEVIDPFGDYGKALAGNVNDSSNPRKYVHSTIFPANKPICVTGRSWEKIDPSDSGNSESHWQNHYTYSTTTSTPNILTLRNGDNAPDLDGFRDQLSAKQFLQAYVNTSTSKMVMNANQVIYLFELGTTDLTSSAADFQDLVILLTLGDNENYLNTLDNKGNPTAATTTAKGYNVNTQWRDNKGYPIAPNLFGTAAGDVLGSKGANNAGGIAGSASFDQWFGDVMGTNLSSQVVITLKKVNGVWEYLTNDFHPIDGASFGDEGKPHNFYFTLNFGIDFTHHAGEHRFVEFYGDDDVWVFIDGKLAMDLGGISAGVKQYLDVDRLGLSDGQQHHLEFFYAQRQEFTAAFNLRTNLDLGEGTTANYVLTGIGD